VGVLKSQDNFCASVIKEAGEMRKNYKRCGKGGDKKRMIK
jgi:hypothetical protein